MKLQVNKTETTEMDVTFPLSFKQQEGIYVHCYDENNCLVVYSDSFNRYYAVVALSKYSPEMNCTKKEVEDAFEKVVNSARLDILK